MESKSKVLLIILDGFGISEATEGNAVHAANPEFINKLFEERPFTRLGASGLDVGLPEGQMGNSEVGHLNIGAGRIVYQDITRINLSIEDGSFFENKTMLDAFARLKKSGKALHLYGLVSDGGVHSHINHISAILKLAKDQGLTRVFIHAFTDGRDTSPTSGVHFIRDLIERTREIGVGQIATISGRYYAMDRDNRWDRTQLAYDAIMRGQGQAAADWRTAVNEAYAAGETDEFIKPRLIDYSGAGEQDVMIYFNYRFDRTRQLTRAICEPDFKDFATVKHDIHFVAMTHYYDGGNFREAYAPIPSTNLLGEVIAKAGLRQLRCAETEKYAHVTFFLNGKKDEPFPGEDRVLIPSPKEVATYDQKPEMSAFPVTEEAIARVKSGVYDLVVLNYANPDMVGHTGAYDAAVRALEAVDKCLGDFVDAVLGAGGAVLVVADHGNVEDLTPGANAAHTYHSMNRVPCILVGHGYKHARLRADGVLADIAPTLLTMLGLPKPAEMDRHSLIEQELEG